MTVKIYQIRGNHIAPDVEQEVGQVTSYRASIDEPITLIHDTHVQMLQEKVSELMGVTLNRDQFMASLGLTDERTSE